MNVIIGCVVMSSVVVTNARRNAVLAWRMRKGEFLRLLQKRDTLTGVPFSLKQFVKWDLSVDCQLRFGSRSHSVCINISKRMNEFVAIVCGIELVLSRDDVQIVLLHMFG